MKAPVFPLLLFIASNFSLLAVVATDNDGGEKLFQNLDAVAEDVNLHSPSTTSRRKLTDQYDIAPGTPVVDICDFNPRPGVFEPLPITVASAEPNVVYALEDAEGVTISVNLCGGAVTGSRVITVWTGINQGEGAYVAYDAKACLGYPANLRNFTWTAPTNDKYYIRFGEVLLGSYTDMISWSTDMDLQCGLCGPSILYPAQESCGDNFNLKCCNKITGAVGPACCGNVPYMPGESSCCGDDSLVAGNDTAACAPSTQPSLSPSSEPSSFPSSQPSILTCEMVDPCDYDLQDDGMGGLEVVETYYPVCVLQEKKKKASFYRQECYPNSTIYGLSYNDEIPGKKNRKIVNCGCCPPEDMLPAGIEEVKRSTPVCGGALDCFAAGITNTTFSDSGQVLFETCINDKAIYEENFYLPSSPNDKIYCGRCIDCEAILELDTGNIGCETGWELRLDGEVIDSRDPYTYTLYSSYVENLAIPDTCFGDCYEITITDSFGDVSFFFQ